MSNDKLQKVSVSSKELKARFGEKFEIELSYEVEVAPEGADEAAARAALNSNVEKFGAARVNELFIRDMSSNISNRVRARLAKEDTADEAKLTEIANETMQKELDGIRDAGGGGFNKAKAVTNVVEQILKLDPVVQMEIFGSFSDEPKRAELFAKYGIKM
jgi:hypothetical protein